MSELTSRDAAIAAIEALENKKGEDITIIDISKVSPIADYFIICNGNNKNQIQTLSDHVEETLGRMGFDSRPIEGYDNANWILMDYHDVIIHIFDKESRSFYDLEHIWRDGTQITKEELENG